MASIEQRGERLARRRAWVAIWASALFVGTGGLRFLTEDTGALHQLRILAWIVWLGLLLAFVLFGSGLLTNAALRVQLDDEVTQAHRREALAWGFWGMLGASAFCALQAAWTNGESIHFIVTFGVSYALGRFGFLEVQALR